MKEKEEEGEVIFSFTKNEITTFLKTEYKGLQSRLMSKTLPILIRPSSSSHQDVKK